MLSSKHYTILRHAEAGAVRANDRKLIRELDSNVFGTRAYCVQLQRMGLLKDRRIRTVGTNGRVVEREEWTITARGSQFLREAGQ